MSNILNKLKKFIKVIETTLIASVFYQSGDTNSAQEIMAQQEKKREEKDPG